MSHECYLSVLPRQRECTVHSVKSWSDTIDLFHCCHFGKRSAHIWWVFFYSELIVAEHAGHFSSLSCAIFVHATQQHKKNIIIPCSLFKGQLVQSSHQESFAAFISTCCFISYHPGYCTYTLNLILSL